MRRRTLTYRRRMKSRRFCSGTRRKQRGGGSGKIDCGCSMAEYRGKPNNFLCFCNDLEKIQLRKDSKNIVEMLRNAEYQEHLNDILNHIYSHYEDLVYYMRTDNYREIQRIRNIINKCKKKYDELLSNDGGKKESEKGKGKYIPLPGSSSSSG